MAFKDLVDLEEVSVHPDDVIGLRPGERFGIEGVWIERSSGFNLFTPLQIDEVRKRLGGGGKK